VLWVLALIEAESAKGRNLAARLHIAKQQGIALGVEEGGRITDHHIDTAVRIRLTLEAVLPGPHREVGAAHAKLSGFRVDLHRLAVDPRQAPGRVTSISSKKTRMPR